MDNHAHVPTAVGAADAVGAMGGELAHAVRVIDVSKTAKPEKACMIQFPKQKEWDAQR